MIGTHDLQCVRRVHKVDDNPMFTYQAQHSPRKYTETFVDWLISKYAEDPNFFKHARELVRVKSPGPTEQDSSINN